MPGDTSSFLLLVVGYLLRHPSSHGFAQRSEDRLDRHGQRPRWEELSALPVPPALRGLSGRRGVGGVGGV